MQIEVQGRDFALTEGLSRAVAAAAHRYGASFQELVRRVAVRVFDVNGPRGGPDKGCLVVADLNDGRVVVGKDVDSDLYRAIPRAFARLERSTRSRRQRTQTLRRTPRTTPSVGREAPAD